MDTSALFKLTYGLFVLTAKDGEKDNGCIINTAMEIANDPTRFMVAVNKANYTHDMLLNSKRAAVSVLDNTVPFDMFKHFGFSSGKEVDKFADFPDVARTAGGLYYITKHVNAYMEGKIVQTTDLGSHTIFVAELEDAKVLNENRSVTYADYHRDIKPKPQAQEEKKGGYVCEICGYVYEGEELPEDFVCPICKHGAGDFRKL